MSATGYYILRVLVLAVLLHRGYALECKTCQKNDRNCLFAQDVQTRTCPTDNDLCFSWFDRTKSHITVQRDCISTDTSDFTLMVELLDGRDSGCVKRSNGMDCVTFCSTDQCN